VDRCVTYILNLRKIGQKLKSLSLTMGILDTHRQTDRHSSDFIYVQCYALHCTVPCLVYDMEIKYDDDDDDDDAWDRQ